MRSTLFFFVTLLLLSSSAAHATRFLGMGRPSARQHHKYAYMLNGHRQLRRAATAQVAHSSQRP
jgi:hypothetical protein